MKKPHQKTNDLLLPHDSDFSAQREEIDTSGEYLNFASNGMTDNEKIDEFNYYDRYLDETAQDDQ